MAALAYAQILHASHGPPPPYSPLSPVHHSSTLTSSSSSSTAPSTFSKGQGVETIAHYDPTTLPNDRQRHDSLHVHNSLSKLICQRHSTRSFLPKQIDFGVLQEVLALAQHAPSNSNLQPWRVTILSGQALSRLSSKLVSRVKSGAKAVTAPIPAEYKKYRSELGHQLYGPEGYDVKREEKVKMQKAQLRNYEFFGAPCAAVVCMSEELMDIDALSVGMWVAMVTLLLAERGLGTCVEVSVVGFPDIIREELGLPESMRPLTGLAIGYEDEQHQINRMSVKRDMWKQSVTFKSD